MAEPTEEDSAAGNMFVQQWKDQQSDRGAGAPWPDVAYAYGLADGRVRCQTVLAAFKADRQLLGVTLRRLHEGSYASSSDALNVLSDLGFMPGALPRHVYRDLEQRNGELMVDRAAARRERDELRRRMDRAIAASDNDGGSASDAIQDMLEILDDDRYEFSAEAD